MVSFSPIQGEMRERSEGRGGEFADAGLVGRPPPSFALLRTPPPEWGRKMRISSSRAGAPRKNNRQFQPLIK